MGTTNKKNIRVFAEGVFDLIHANHVAYLNEAKALGDYLIVGVTNDNLAASYKRRPIIPENLRLEMVSNIKAVDECFIMNSPLVPETIEDVIRKHSISIVAYAGSSWDNYYKPAIDRGIFRRLDYHEGISTSQIIETARTQES